MLTRKLPVDELCLHAIATYLNIHITVDYIGGIWTTLDIPQIHHDLATILSDIHFVYRRSCKYNLLCRKSALRTIGRKLMIHKNRHDLPEVTVVLHRVEEWNQTAMRLINEDLAELNLSSYDENSDSDSTEIYGIHKNKQELPEVSLVLHRVEEYNPMAMRLINKGLAGFHLSSQNENIDSDSTEIYEIQENVIGTIYYLPNDTKTKKPSKPQRAINVTSSPYPFFKYPFSRCKFRAKRQKETSDHHRTVHKNISRCKICRKSYNTPHSLKQHLYKHAKVTKNYVCKSCGISYPFHSQLQLHKLKHSRKYQEECTEYCLTFKYQHDMLKHCREHTAEELGCNKCEYTSTRLNLKAHQKQHDTTYVIECAMCKGTFKHWMSLWRHSQDLQEKWQPRVLNGLLLMVIFSDT